MESNIIQIGNSNGVILPAKLLRQTGMDRQTKVSIIANMDEKAIIIKPLFVKVGLQQPNASMRRVETPCLIPIFLMMI